MQTAKRLLIIGHRGAKGLAAENTTESFECAIKYKAGALETDIRVSKDGVPILVHDTYIQSKTNTIKKLTYEQIVLVKPDVVRLDEFLKRYANKHSLVLEIKPQEPIETILLVMRAHFGKHFTGEGLAIASFDFRILKNMQQALPAATYVVNERWSGIRATHRAKALKTKRITMNKLWLWSGFIASMNNSGFELTAYTLNDPNKAKKWQAHGLFGVVTDMPNKFNRDIE